MSLPDRGTLKRNFKRHLHNMLSDNSELKFLLFEIFVYGTAYIVGGYFRDFINNKESRDVDILIDLNNEKLIDIIKDSGIRYSINRHKGIKLHLTNVDVDMWSIENNWAFKQELVKLNEDDKLTSIANGCFYNYDSLVINLHNFNYNIRNYNTFSKENTLDILQKLPKYKLLNPTVNANILRAFYLRKRYDCKYSSNTKHYLITKLGELRDENAEHYTPLVDTRAKYPKYEKYLSLEDIYSYITELYDDNRYNGQYFLKF